MGSRIKSSRLKSSRNFYFLFFKVRFSVATLFWLVALFVRVRIEDSSRNRFAFNGIPRHFFGGIFSEGIFSGYRRHGISPSFQLRKFNSLPDYNQIRKITRMLPGAVTEHQLSSTNSILIWCISKVDLLFIQFIFVQRPFVQRFSSNPNLT